METYSDEELVELFDAFDLTVRYNRHTDTGVFSLVLSEALVPTLKDERPPRSGRTSLSIAGAGFEPATSGL
jgi:hypothetical protein